MQLPCAVFLFLLIINNVQSKNDTNSSITETLIKELNSVKNTQLEAKTLSNISETLINENVSDLFKNNQTEYGTSTQTTGANTTLKYDINATNISPLNLCLFCQLTMKKLKEINVNPYKLNKLIFDYLNDETIKNKLIHLSKNTPQKICKEEKFCTSIQDLTTQKTVMPSIPPFEPIPGVPNWNETITNMTLVVNNDQIEKNLLAESTTQQQLVDIYSSYSSSSNNTNSN